MVYVENKNGAPAVIDGFDLIEFGYIQPLLHQRSGMGHAGDRLPMRFGLGKVPLVITGANRVDPCPSAGDQNISVMRLCCQPAAKPPGGLGRRQQTAAYLDDL
jgi:hypothetical protein